MITAQWIGKEIETFYCIIVAAIIFLFISSVSWVPLKRFNNKPRVSKQGELDVI